MASDDAIYIILCSVMPNLRPIPIHPYIHSRVRVSDFWCIAYKLLCSFQYITSTYYCQMAKKFETAKNELHKGMKIDFSK